MSAKEETVAEKLARKKLELEERLRKLEEREKKVQAVLEQKSKRDLSSPNRKYSSDAEGSARKGSPREESSGSHSSKRHKKRKKHKEKKSLMSVADKEMKKKQHEKKRTDLVAVTLPRDSNLARRHSNEVETKPSSPPSNDNQTLVGGARPAQTRRNWRTRVGNYGTLNDMANKYRRSTAGVEEEKEEKKEDVSALDKRERVVLEMLQTEKDYVRDLQLIVDLYKKPLVKRGLVSKEDINILFSNLEQLQEVNGKLLVSLEEAQGESGGGVGKAFIEVSSYLMLYTDYVSNQDAALDKLVQLTQEVEGFNTFALYTQWKPESRNLDLKSFLIKPIQRVCKYPLLLRELLKNTDESHVEYGDIVKAKDMIEEVVKDINKKKKELENNVKKLSVIDRCPSLQGRLDASVKYFCEGNVIIETPKGEHVERYYFLFSTAIVIAELIRKKRAPVGGTLRKGNAFQALDRYDIDNVIEMDRVSVFAPEGNTLKFVTDDGNTLTLSQTPDDDTERITRKLNKIIT